MRRNRELKEKAIYHVTNKINRNEFIFELKYVKEMLFTVIQLAHKKYKFEMKQFCIMDNHVHFMIKPKGESTLPEIMRWIKSVFAIRYNKMYGYTGHVWQGRYHSVIIKTMQHFYNVFRYICENPVKAGICDDMRDYAWSGLNFLADPPDFLRMPKFLVRWLMPEITLDKS